MVEKVIKLFLGGVLLVLILKYPDFIVAGMQSFVDAVVRTASAVVHLKLATAGGATSTVTTTP